MLHSCGRSHHESSNKEKYCVGENGCHGRCRRGHRDLIDRRMRNRHLLIEKGGVEAGRMAGREGLGRPGGEVVPEGGILLVGDLCLEK
jgi:hypothetical protein